MCIIKMLNFRFKSHLLLKTKIYETNIFCRRRLKSTIKQKKKDRKFCFILQNLFPDLFRHFGDSEIDKFSLLVVFASFLPVLLDQLALAVSVPTHVRSLQGGFW